MNYMAVIRNQKLMAVIVVGIIMIGGFIIIISRGATAVVSVEAENGNVVSPASVCTDPAASGGRCVKFSSGSTPTPPPTTPPTQPPAGGTVTVLAVSDTTGHCGRTGGDTCVGAKPASDRAVATPADAIIMAGDYTPNALLSEFTTYFEPTWGRLKSKIRAAPGNHEKATGGMPGYFGYFGSSVNPPKGYYSFDIGAWHMVALNSNASVAEQAAWLRTDLASHKTSCTMAYWHEPLFTSSGKRSGDPAFKPLWDELYAANAEVVVNGHNHQYERFAPQNPAGARDDAKGIVQIVPAVGGDDLYPFGTPKPNSLVRRNDTYGFVKFSLAPTSWSSQFISAAGATLDSASGVCR